MKNLGRLVILLVIISILASGVVFTVNNSSTTGAETQDAFNPGGSQVTALQDQAGSRPEFQGDFREREGSSLSAAAEIFKNLGIILAITAGVVIVEKGISIAKKVRKAPAPQV